METKSVCFSVFAFPSLGSRGKTHRVKQHQVEPGGFFYGFPFKKHHVLSHYPAESLLNICLNRIYHVSRDFLLKLR